MLLTHPLRILITPSHNRGSKSQALPCNRMLLEHIHVQNLYVFKTQTHIGFFPLPSPLSHPTHTPPPASGQLRSSDSSDPITQPWDSEGHCISSCHQHNTHKSWQKDGLLGAQAHKYHKEAVRGIETCKSFPWKSPSTCNSCNQSMKFPSGSGIFEGFRGIEERGVVTGKRSVFSTGFSEATEIKSICNLSQGEPRQ